MCVCELPEDPSMYNDDSSHVPCHTYVLAYGFQFDICGWSIAAAAAALLLFGYCGTAARDRDPICKKACFRTMLEIAPFFNPTMAAVESIKEIEKNEMY